MRFPQPTRADLTVVAAVLGSIPIGFYQPSTVPSLIQMNGAIVIAYINHQGKDK